jgi:protein TonB
MAGRAALLVSAGVLTLSLVGSLASAQDPQPLRVGGVIKAPTKIVDVAPVYPEIAQAAGAEGVVILELLVDPTGAVSSARVIRSVPLLDEAALQAVYGWVYTPTFLNGVAVPIYYNVTISFSLKDATQARANTPGTPPSVASLARPPVMSAQAASPDAIEQARAVAVRVGGAVRAPRKITNVDPVYPPIAVAAGTTGTVILELLVGADGHVLDGKVIRSIPLLNEAALNAAMQWVYEPPLVNGSPNPVIYNVTVTFSKQQ